MRPLHLQMETSEEVTVSVGNMVMVKAEGVGDCEDSSKTQVILQLQPITAGDESAETNAAVMAVETSSEQQESEDVEIGCPITCGDCKAVLLVNKFVCPGINVKCVKYEDQLISPKQFVHISGKATLKDWKRAIRMGGVMLRKMMDSGQLDFFQHSTLCTNTCRSTKFDLLINNTRFPPGSGGLTTPTPSHAQTVVGNGGTATEDQADILAGKSDWISTSLDSGDKKSSNEISEDTLNFWKGIADVGLLGEVVTNINTELEQLLSGVLQNREQPALQDTEVAILSNLAQVFGLLDSVKRILEKRKQQTDPSEEEVLSTLANLEAQLEEQKKQQELRAYLSCPQSGKTKTPGRRGTKRPRLQRPASTTTLLASPVGQQAALQPQQFTFLSTIPMSSVGQPFTVAGLPMVSLAQSSNTVTLLPAGSQLFTRYMLAGDGKADAIALHPSSGLTLVGAATMQDSPVELVQLSQQGDAHQEHTVIEINPAPVEQAVMELQLSEEAGQEAAEAQSQEGQSAGVQLDAAGQLTGVQILVIEENAQDPNKVK